MGLIDYHIHPSYSIDAAPVTVDEYCACAMELGLKEICFTPHLEVDPVRKNKDWFVRYNMQLHKMDDLHWLEMLFNDIFKARSKYKPGLKVKAGIEVGYERGCEAQIDHILSRFPFDFVLGAIHCLDHIAISSKKESHIYFKQKTYNEVAQAYFSKLEDAVKTNLFDCVAHIDLYRRYGANYLGKDIDILHQGYIEPIFHYMAAHKIALEINTSGLRRGLNDLHPSMAILEAAVQAGITLYTVGSDAHAIFELGKGLQQATSILNKYSLSVSTFTNRNPDLIKGVDKPDQSI